MLLYPPFPKNFQFHQKIVPPSSTQPSLTFSGCNYGDYKKKKKMNHYLTIKLIHATRMYFFPI